MENRNRQVLLKRRPTGAPTTADFDIADGPMPDPGNGETLVRGIYLSLDPYMRGRISGVRSYAKPVDIGAVMEGRVVGQVVRSRDPGFREGDYVYGGYGWQLYSAVPAKDLIKLDPNEAPLSTALGVLGMPGLTAYVGLSEIGRPQLGETVVVSASSGAVGAVVGQLAKRSGARAVGIAGGADKCRYVEGELVLTPASTIARQIWAPRSTAPVPKASTFIGRMSVVRSSKRCSHGSTISAAW
jgi:NADPH-dependent curcumin reductase CurA